MFPTGCDPDKYWPPVARIDQAYGDRNLVCSCPSPEAFAERAGAWTADARVRSRPVTAAAGSTSLLAREQADGRLPSVSAAWSATASWCGPARSSGARRVRDRARRAVPDRLDHQDAGRGAGAAAARRGAARPQRPARRAPARHRRTATAPCATCWRTPPACTPSPPARGGSARRAARSTSWPRARRRTAPAFAAGRDRSTTPTSPSRCSARWWPAARRRRGGTRCASAILAPLGMTRTTYLPEAPHADGLQRAPLRRHADRRARPRRRRDGAGRPGVEHGRRPGAATPRSSPTATPTCCRARRSSEMATPQSGTRAAALASAHGLGFQLARGGSGMLVGHTGSMPGFLAGVLRRPASVVRARWCWPTRPGHALRGAAPSTCSATLETPEPTLPEPWRPSRDVPAAVARDARRLALGQHRAARFAWDGREVVVSNPRAARRGAPVRAAGRRHLPRHPRLPPRRDAARRTQRGRRINHLVCETFVYTRAPYDPAAPIPGGHPHAADLAHLVGTCRPDAPSRRRSGRRFAESASGRCSVGLGDGGHVEVGDPQRRGRGAREVVAPLAARSSARSRRRGRSGAAGRPGSR